MHSHHCTDKHTVEHTEDWSDGNHPHTSGTIDNFDRLQPDVHIKQLSVLLIMWTHNQWHCQHNISTKKILVRFKAVDIYWQGWQYCFGDHRCTLRHPRFNKYFVACTTFLHNHVWYVWITWPPHFISYFYISHSFI